MNNQSLRPAALPNQYVFGQEGSLHHIIINGKSQHKHLPSAELTEPADTAATMGGIDQGQGAGRGRTPAGPINGAQDPTYWIVMVQPDAENLRSTAQRFDSSSQLISFKTYF